VPSDQTAPTDSSTSKHTLISARHDALAGISPDFFGRSPPPTAVLSEPDDMSRPLASKTRSHNIGVLYSGFARFMGRLTQGLQNGAGE